MIYYIKNKMRFSKKGKIAIGEILILIIATFAFAWMVGGSIGFVKGGEDYDGLENYYDNAMPSPREDDGSTNQEKKEVIEGVAKTWSLKEISSIVKHPIMINFAYASAVYLAVEMVGGLADLEKDQVDAASKSAFVGTFMGRAIGQGIYRAGEKAGEKEATGWIVKSVPKAKKFFTLGEKLTTSTSVAVFWGTVIAVGIFLATYKNKKTKIVTFECKSWQAPSGGKDCEKCNENELFPCSEYQCRALGQGCELVDGKCIWKNKKDAKYPIITLDKNALNEGYEYVGINERGARIVKKGSETGCVDWSTPLSFGINTDESAICKIDYERKEKFEEMEYTFPGKGYHHVIQLPTGLLKVNSSTESPIINKEGDYEFYIRCQDGNGNSNTANFVIKFCVEAGPDLETPIIVTTSIREGGYFKYGLKEIKDFKIGVNEPAECKWSRQDKSYEDMENTMDCSTEETEINLQMLYECSTTLNGLEDGKENKFYFKCKDKNGNINKESYEFILKGTEGKLNIDSVSPEEGVVRGSTKPVKVELEVETSSGAEEGKAYCYYGETEDYESGLFSETNSYHHKQELRLDPGDYKFYIWCIDNGGNEAKTTVSFKVESDDEAPIVVRAYKDGYDLKIITNEEAECVYGTKDCNYFFKDGTLMDTIDDNGNEPSSGCSIVIKPTSF